MVGETSWFIGCVTRSLFFSRYLTTSESSLFHRDEFNDDGYDFPLW